MAKKLGYNDFLNVDYMPGEPDLVKKNAKKRKQDTATGSNAEYSSTHAPQKEDTNESLNVQQRRARSRSMKKYKSRLAIGRKRAAAKLATSDTLKRRARKAARSAIAKKLTKGIAKSDLTFARKQEIEKRLEKMTGRINKLATKMVPKIRKAEMERKRSKK